ncbi:MAG: ferrochelatase [Candidatus Latescibacteria bacterium]|nr:ferrochelatase [Candidatus Latescibacterota bacterium]
MTYDAALMIAFGGPERPADIRPFLANVTWGRPIPPARVEEVAHHYERIGGKSPLNDITFRQAHALEAQLRADDCSLPVYVGMRNWHPFLSETARQMHADGRRRAVGLIMAAHQCDASWEKYQRNVTDALTEEGVALDVVYTPPVFDHPLFIDAVAGRVERCLARLPEVERATTPLVFTAHSIPAEMAAASPYEQQLTTSARLVAERLRHAPWQLAYQSRSGRPQDPWLEPDVCATIRDLAAHGVRAAVVVPVGFVCDHVEVLYDLDIEAAGVAREVGLTMLRTETVNDDPLFIEALAENIKAVTSDK